MDQLLSQASALNPGCDLWVAADAAHSRWTLRLDWCLGFQILRSQRHRREKPAASLLETVNLADLGWVETPVSSGAPLLIAAHPSLPARWVAAVPIDDGDLASWTARIHELWKGLGRPSLKVFLPTGLAAGSFTEEWKRLAEGAELSLVLDQDPQMQ